MCQKFNLSEAVSYQPSTVVSRVLMGGKDHKGTVTTFAFSKGEGLSEHSAPYDALVVNLGGEGAVVISGKTHLLSEGEAIIMPANEPHAIKAMSDFKMLLIMIRE